MPKTTSMLAAAAAGVAAFALLALAMISDLWFPEGPFDPVWRVAFIFLAFAGLAWVLATANRWDAQRDRRFAAIRREGREAPSVEEHPFVPPPAEAPERRPEDRP